MIGKYIHSYEINAHLGQGGMGNVYRATDSMLGREVALKMLHPQLTSQPHFLERFKKEARVLAQLLHPHIAVIYNFIEQDGHHYMVMEYVEGTSLDDLLKTHKSLPVQFVVPVCVQALEGLQHAHKKNIFHRDIKPSNLMLTAEGTLKLMDFGIAKVAGEQKMTQVNKIVGTIEFMAPELIEGKQASVFSDIYAMGVTMYELVSGKLPFESDTDYNLMQSILKKRAMPPDKLNPSVPKALSDIILKAMEKNPENRYQTARAFQQALIAAFPNYREIDLNILKQPKETVLVSPLTGKGSFARKGREKDASLLETRAVENAKPSSIAAIFQTKILANKRLPYILGGVGLLFFLFIIISLNFGKESQVSPQNKIPVKTDTVKPVEKQVPLVIAPPVDNSSPTQHAQAQPPTDTGSGDETVAVKPKKRKEEITREENRKNNPENNDTEKTAEKKEATPPEVKHTETKTIYIDSKVEVNLYLSDNLGDVEREKNRTVTFTVAGPVYYQGVTIIKQGAVAKGDITIGRMFSSVNIYFVAGANGQQLELKSAKFRRRRKELDSDRNYTAILQEGVRMSFE
jgi:serine/threonine protein kinase